jgi:hypothetical protein
LVVAGGKDALIESLTQNLDVKLNHRRIVTGAPASVLAVADNGIRDDDRVCSVAVAALIGGDRSGLSEK